MWFNTWTELGRVALSAVLVYLVLVVLVRLAGKRTIASMNVADFVITIAIGSGVASTILDTRLAIVTGLFGLTMLVLLQYATQSLTTRSTYAQQAIEATPRLLVYRGRMLKDVIRGENVNETEILQALREHGVSAVEDVYAVILEIDGQFSVIVDPSKSGTDSALRDVHRPTLGR